MRGFPELEDDTPAKKALLPASLMEMTLGSKWSQISRRLLIFLLVFFIKPTNEVDKLGLGTG